jgi:uncharacterized membrane protein YagU involved in acid resistance
MTTRTARLDAPSFWRPVLYAGLVAGVLDLTYALVVYGMRGVPPLTILQSISSGLLGSAAFEQGAATAALGVVLHFLIMLVICWIYRAASRRLPVLTERPVVMGLLYGVAVYVVMNFVVVPLSAVPGERHFTVVSIALAAFPMLFFVGLPIALITRRFG